MESTEYQIEIYQPGSEDIWMSFESPTPFGTINKGDILDPGMWPESQSPLKVLRVVEVRHLIWKRHQGHLKHGIMVFTEEVDNHHPHSSTL